MRDTNNFPPQSLMKSRISLNMKNCCNCLLFVIPISLSFATFAHAGEISTKASDLIPVNDQLFTSNQKDFAVTQNINTENTSQFTEKNYWYSI